MTGDPNTDVTDVVVAVANTDEPNIEPDCDVVTAEPNTLEGESGVAEAGVGVLNTDGLLSVVAVGEVVEPNTDVCEDPNIEPLVDNPKIDEDEGGDDETAEANIELACDVVVVGTVVCEATAAPKIDAAEELLEDENIEDFGEAVVSAWSDSDLSVSDLGVEIGVITESILALPAANIEEALEDAGVGFSITFAISASTSVLMSLAFASSDTVEALACAIFSGNTPKTDVLLCSLGISLFSIDFA